MAGSSQISHDEHHRALVRRLSAEVRPTHQLWPVGARVALWMVMEISVAAWAIGHTSNHFAQKLTNPVYVIEIVFFVVAAIIFAVFAFRSAIPGRTLPATGATLAGVFVLAGTIVLTMAAPIDTAGHLGDFVRSGLRCAFDTVMFGALPWLALWWLVGRGAPMSGALSGLFVGAGSLLFSFAVMRVVCPIDEPLHLLTWHLLPALLAIALSTLAGVVWLRFRPRARLAVMLER
jgi:hypothetical protein